MLSLWSFLGKKFVFFVRFSAFSNVDERPVENVEDDEGAWEEESWTSKIVLEDEKKFFEMFSIETYLSIQIEICCGVIVVQVIFCAASSFSVSGASIVTDSVLLPFDIPPFVKGLKSSTLSVVMIGIEPELCYYLKNF